MRIDSGSVTTGSTTFIFDNNNRLSLLDINGGTFTSNAPTGIDVGAGGAAFSYAELLVRGTGVLNTHTITLGSTGQTSGLDGFEAVGGTTYIGSGGIVELTGSSAVTETVAFGSNTVSTAPIIAASANWSSSVAITLGTSSGGVAPTFQAANSSGTAENITLGGVLSGNSGFTKTGAGNLTLSAAETYSGATSVTAGTLIVSGSLSGATSLSVSGGGTAELTASNAVSNTAHVTLAGGTLQTLANQTQSLSDLTLGAGSSTLSIGSTGSIINFADSSTDTWTGTLAISNWNGSVTGGGSDQVFIGATNDLTVGQLADITFTNGYLNGAFFSTDSAVQLNDGEIVAAAIPEPGTWAMMLAGIGMLTVWQRSRRNRRRDA
jgi:autotransporter-associated beta strand protein